MNQAITLLNGAEIQFRSTGVNGEGVDRLRSDGYNMVVLDEFAMMPASVLGVIQPTLAATNGVLFICTTPKGFNHAHKFWTECKDDPDWHCFQADYRVSPHYSASFIEKAKKKLGTNLFNQEYGACFTSPDGSRFKFEWYEHIMVDTLPDVYQHSVIAVDLSRGGLKSDYQAIGFVGYQNNCWWVDMDCELMPIPVLTQQIISKYNKYRPTQGLYFETNGDWREVAETIVSGFKITPPIAFAPSSENKLVRMDRVGIPLERGLLKIKRSPGGDLLWGQIAMHPQHKKVQDGGLGDDALDCCELGITFLEQLINGQVMTVYR